MSRAVALMWSGGKDAVLALEALHADDRWRVEALVTTVTEGDERVTMHGVARALVTQQALEMDLPLYGMHIPEGATNQVYENRLSSVFKPITAQGIGVVACGDVYLEDVRAYREDLFERNGMEAIFPIWGSETEELSERFVSMQHRAVVTSVHTDALPRDAAGRMYDRQFVRELPDGVDPCGEGGEFHTFVFGGPLFRREITYRLGQGYVSGPMWVLPVDRMEP